MEGRSFFAPNTRQAIHMIRQTLGDEAVIISNTRVPGGVEIKAALPQATPEPAPVAKATVDAPKQPAANPDPMLANMSSELTLLRGMLEHQMSQRHQSELRGRNTTETALMGRLNRIGLQTEVCQHIARQVNCDQGFDIAWAQAQTEIANSLVVTGDECQQDGGTIALVGPTGVGKTTTIAKLAARFVMQHGAENIGLITSDFYRIAGREQLRIYGKILGIPVTVVNNEYELTQALHHLRHKKWVLVDTAGVSQRDIHIAQKLALITQQNLKTYLVLSATSHQTVLDEAILAFKIANISACIMTKTDEGTSLGQLLGICMQHQLPIAYTCGGQRVPHDLDVAEPRQLLQQAIEASHHYQSELHPMNLSDMLMEEIA